mmetsp:Transcript_77268/g.153315  ORF Transcript_77268/g.153315 Transcript_77268/m.153315 type:complete len:316 (-) Transcript_77268:149-1096(-)
MDIDVAATLIKDLVSSGIRVEKNCEVVSFDVPDLTKPVQLSLGAPGGSKRPPGTTCLLKVDAYLAAIGREPNVADLEVENAGIDCDKYGNIILSGPTMQTSVSHIYAAGDVVGRPFLASTGVAQGISAVRHMFGCAYGSKVGISANTSGSIEDGSLAASGDAFDPGSIASNPFAFPNSIWSSPEVAYFGLSLPQAQSRGINASESLALYEQCLRGVVFSPLGLLKLVFEKPSGQLLGVHIVGDDACELIHYGMELVRAGRTIYDILSNTYSAVTFHELYQIAARAGVDGKAARRQRAKGPEATKRKRAKLQLTQS